MPNPKDIRVGKRVAGSTTLRAVAVGSAISEYPKYFVVCVDDKAAEALLRQQLQGVPVATGKLAMEAQRVIQTAMSGSNPPC